MISSRVGVLIFAAGYSRRFGESDKRHAKLANGRSLLATSVARAQQAFASVRVVIREDDDADLFELPDNVPVIRVSQAHFGLGASLSEAMAILIQGHELQEIDAVAIALGDMPCIHQNTLLTLQGLATQNTIVRPCFEGRKGHPVIFGREMWPALQSLRGGLGAKAVIQQFRSQYQECRVQDAGILFDVDVPADIRHANNLQALFQISPGNRT